MKIKRKSARGGQSAASFRAGREQFSKGTEEMQNRSEIPGMMIKQRGQTQTNVPEKGLFLASKLLRQGRKTERFY